MTGNAVPSPPEGLVVGLIAGLIVHGVVLEVEQGDRRVAIGETRSPVEDVRTYACHEKPGTRVIAGADPDDIAIAFIEIVGVDMAYYVAVDAMLEAWPGDPTCVDLAAVGTAPAMSTSARSTAIGGPVPSARIPR